jgi:hypothetical protein
MLMVSTPQSKATDWQTGLKRKAKKICCLKEIHLIDRNKHCVRVKGCKKIYQGNGP